jgi:dolichol-phosphate mannosyltransferase
MGVEKTVSPSVTSHIWWWVLAVGELIALAVVAPRLWRAARGGRRLHQGEVDGVAISVVIPARNEAMRIAECLAPLRAAPGVREVIVVDDESTDDTATIARELGAMVIVGKPLPEGWVGKIWALQQGIAAATADVVVTLDADTRPDPQLPLAAARALAESKAMMATVAPKFRTTSLAGEWLHAAMLTSLVYRHGAGAGRATSDAVANGQCMVFRRDDAVGGKWCERVRGSTVEDVALVRTLVADGASVEMFDGTELLTVQMFDGAGDTWRGWGRSLSLAGEDRTSRQVGDAAVTAITMVTPLWLMLLGIPTPVTAVLLLVRVGTLVGTRRAYERSGPGYWLSPIADVVAWLAVVRGILAPSRQWRGRQY